MGRAMKSREGKGRWFMEKKKELETLKNKIRESTYGSNKCNLRKNKYIETFFPWVDTHVFNFAVVSVLFICRRFRNI
jgi:hypothetical protein